MNRNIAIKSIDRSNRPAHFFAMVVKVTASQFLSFGLETVGFKADRNDRTCLKTKMNRFRGSFGCGPAACSAVFQDLQTTDNPDARINKPNSFYFLVAINWLATYKKECEMAGFFDTDDKTLRVHINSYVKAIAALKDEKIVWDIDGNEETFLISVDGVHFRINELRRKPSARWCSYKFKSAGLAYEIGISIYYNRVVWINGPYQAADGDKEIYMSKLKKKMPKGKKAVADRGYKCQETGEKTLSIRNSEDTEAVKAFKRRVRARHENFNARLKAFKILDSSFRAKKERLKKHKAAFEAVCVLCQYDMENGHPLFDV